MFVKPAPAGTSLPGAILPDAPLRVFDPDRLQPLPQEGAEVPRSSYWLRRLADHDVVEISQPGQPAAAKQKRGKA